MIKFVCSVLLFGVLFFGCAGDVLAALRCGYKDVEVKNIQVELLRRGYYITEVDGVFGPETEAAVKLFQYQHQLPDTGVVNYNTYQVLFARNYNIPKSNVQSIVALDYAISMLGVPYAFGGESRRGIDCSAFTQQAFARAGIKIPRTADLQYEAGRHLQQSEIQAGDMVFYTTYEPGASHCGIYMGNGKFIHAGSSTGVTVADAFTGYWGRRYFSACRFI